MISKLLGAIFQFFIVVALIHVALFSWWVDPNDFTIFICIAIYAWINWFPSLGIPSLGSDESSNNREYKSSNNRESSNSSGFDTRKFKGNDRKDAQKIFKAFGLNKSKRK
jgi:hypothetical protein